MEWEIDRQIGGVSSKVDVVLCHYGAEMITRLIDKLSGIKNN